MPQIGAFGKLGDGYGERFRLIFGKLGWISGFRVGLGLLVVRNAAQDRASDLWKHLKMSAPLRPMP